MSSYSLSKTRFAQGVWEGVIAADSAAAPAPEIAVTLNDRPVPSVSVTPGDEAGFWLLRVPVAAELIADGTHTFLISDTASGQALGDFSIIAGDAAAEDIRAELSLLRAELDMLKRSFRRHCRETV